MAYSAKAPSSSASPLHPCTTPATRSPFFQSPLAFGPRSSTVPTGVFELRLANVSFLLCYLARMILTPVTPDRCSRVWLDPQILHQQTAPHTSWTAQTSLTIKSICFLCLSIRPHPACPHHVQQSIVRGKIDQPIRRIQSHVFDLDENITTFEIRHIDVLNLRLTRLDDFDCLHCRWSQNRSSNQSDKTFVRLREGGICVV